MSNVMYPMGFVRVPLIALTVTLVGTMLPFGNVCQASNDMKLWLALRSINDSKPNVASFVIFRVRGILAGSHHPLSFRLLGCLCIRPSFWISVLPLFL